MYFNNLHFDNYSNVKFRISIICSINLKSTPMYFHTIHFREHKTYMKERILCRTFYVKIVFVSLFMFGCVLTHIPLCT